MNDLQVFKFENKEVRSVVINGKPWFVAKDVCDILEIQNARDAIRDFPENEKFAVDSNYAKTLGFQHATAGVNLVNEPGLYRLVFQSRKPEAEAFKTWVFTEVLPAIYKTGTYTVPGREDPLAEWKKNYPYPFFLMDDFPARSLRLLRLLDKGMISPRECRKAVIGTGIMPRLPEAPIKTFAEKNIKITGSMSDYVKAEDLYNLYGEQNADDMSQSKLTRGIKEIYPGLIYKQKKIDGYPVLVFFGCKLKKARQKQVAENTDAGNAG